MSDVDLSKVLLESLYLVVVTRVHCQVLHCERLHCFLWGVDYVDAVFGYMGGCCYSVSHHKDVLQWSILGSFESADFGLKS